MHRASEMLRELAQRYRTTLSHPPFRISVLISFVFFATSLVANYKLSQYATSKASNPVDDIILSNTPVFEVDGFFVYGALLLIVFLTLLCLAHPKRIPFTLYSLGLFYLIRAVFISLTHLASFPLHTPIDFTSSIGIFFSELFFGDDLFFSGHTGAPFLMALIYWRDVYLRYVFLLWATFMGIVVLLGHIHYSIDVVSAFFITYGIWHIAEWLFASEKEMFYRDMREFPRSVSRDSLFAKRHT